VWLQYFRQVLPLLYLPPYVPSRPMETPWIQANLAGINNSRFCSSPLRAWI
jgi:hypothetical protein